MSLETLENLPESSVLRDPEKRHERKSPDIPDMSPNSWLTKKGKMASLLEINPAETGSHS